MKTYSDLITHTTGKFSVTAIDSGTARYVAERAGYTVISVMEEVKYA